MPAEETPVTPFNMNEHLPSLWIDSISVAQRSDDICVISFFANMPSGMFEQTRVLTGTAHLKNFIDAMCKTMNYFPEQEKKK